MEYKQRMDLLNVIRALYHAKTPVEERRLKFEMYEVVEKEEDVKSFHDKYVSEGYEGVMVRNLNGMYKRKHRSNDLQKFKEFEDTEFEIVGWKVGKCTEEGAIVFEVKYADGKTFDVRPRGSIEKRIEMSGNGDTYLGKLLTVRYQKTGLDDGSLPRFPVGIVIRDYE